MRHVKVNGVEVAYEVVGRGEPILFIHGAHIADAMRPLAEDPALDRFQRIRYHRRGVGGSGCPPEARATAVALHVDDAVRLLEHLGVERAHVVGHSSGGSIALEIASRHPTRVSSLVLLEPALMMVPSGAAFVDLVTPLVERYEGGDAESAVHGFLALVGDRELAQCDRADGARRDRAGGEGRRHFLRQRAACRLRLDLRARAAPQPSHARFCPCSAPRRAPCSSKAMRCSTSGSRNASMRTSPAPATCSRWKPPDQSRRRSPPSCSDALPTAAVATTRGE